MKSETYSSGGEIECPVCGDTFGDLWDYAWRSDEEIETNCPCCGAPILLFRSVTVDYTARPLPNAEEVCRG